MKAVVLHEYGGPDQLKYEDVADPVAGEGELLVRLTATSVNPIDYKMRSGAAKEHFPVTFPGILGRDIVGIVREVGQGVSGFAPGDRVLALGKHSYAELVVVKAQDAALAPEGLELADAAALPLVTLTGEQLVRRGTAIEQGQTILVSGAVGGVGRSAVWTAKKAGARVIAGVKKKQMEEARGLGADEVIALDDASALEKLDAVDAVADTVGGKTAETLLGKVKQGGSFGSVLGPPANAAMYPAVKVTPVMAVPDAGALRAMAEDVAANRFAIPIDRMIPLKDAGAGQAAAEKGGIGKVLLLA